MKFPAFVGFIACLRCKHSPVAIILIRPVNISCAWWLVARRLPSHSCWLRMLFHSDVATTARRATAYFGLPFHRWDRDNPYHVTALVLHTRCCNVHLQLQMPHPSPFASFNSRCARYAQRSPRRSAFWTTLAILCCLLAFQSSTHHYWVTCFAPPASAHRERMRDDPALVVLCWTSGRASIPPQD